MSYRNDYVAKLFTNKKVIKTDFTFFSFSNSSAVNDLSVAFLSLITHPRSGQWIMFRETEEKDSGTQRNN